MFCKKCGEKIVDGGKFCPACGTPAEQSNGEYVEEITETSIAVNEKQEENKMYEHPGEEETEKLFATVSTWCFLGYRILAMIPVLGWIFMLVIAFDENKNKANFARSYFLGLIIQILILILFYSSITGFLWGILN